MRQSSILMGSAMPAAIAGRLVRAEADPAKLIAQINAAVQEMRGDITGRVDSLYDDFAAFRASMMLNGGEPQSSWRPEDPDYSRLFASFLRSGADEASVREANAQGVRRDIRAAMSEGSASDGGYVAPTEWDRRINQALLPISPLRRLAAVQVTSVGAYTTLWNDQSWGTGWVGETASRPATSTASLASITFGHGEIYANAFATQRILDDAQIDIGQWMTSQVDATFSRQEAIAFLSGDGVNKPFGLLQYVTGGAAAAQHPGGVLQSVPSGAAAAITPDALVTLTYNLTAPYRPNSSWLMNSTTAAAIMQLKDGQGRFIWNEALASGQPPTLLGRPVALDENMPSIGAGNYAIAYGDFRQGYLINDRMGTGVLRDPYTNKPYVGFYMTKRVGGGVLDPNAIRLMKIGVS